MEFQPQINIGMIGHVSDGKSTLVKALTGQSTQRFSKEKEANLTIKLGYANCKIIKCTKCPKPECFGSTSSNTMIYQCSKCNSKAELVNHVSFVDCPGHHSFMQTMLSGTSVMDYTILVESLGNKQIPAPQTVSHLECIQNTSIENSMVILNKIDLANREKTLLAMNAMKEFIKNYKAKNNPIIPISASLNINIDIVCSILAELKPKEKQNNDFRLNIIRSFNVNKPGTTIEELKGGVIGGSIQSGKISVNDTVYIYPGIIYESENKYKPIKTKILSINSDKNKLKSATTGGLIGLMLDIDPGLTGNDKLVGNVIVKEYCSGSVTNCITIDFNIPDSISCDNLFINISSQTIKVKSINNSVNNSINNIVLNLENLIYVELNDNLTIFSKEIETINFIGIGKIIDVVNFYFIYFIIVKKDLFTIK